MFYGEPKTLIVVYKDEMLLNQLKKLVEEKDDSIESTVGIKDGTVRIVSWTEKVWIAQKELGTISNKVLFLGDIKGMDALIPVLNIKFDEYGVKYGWAGDQAALFADLRALTKREYYEAFLSELHSMPVPEVVKSENKRTFGRSAEDMQSTFAEDESSSRIVIPKIKRKRENVALAKTRSILLEKAEAVSSTLEKVGDSMSETAEELMRDKNAMRRQMLFYGLIKFYNNDLEAFIHS